MSNFATFSFFDDERRTSIRLREDGHVGLIVTAIHGEQVFSIEQFVDSDSAKALVMDAAMLTPDLRHTGGDITIGFGHGDFPTMWSMHEHELPLDALVFARQMKELCGDLVATYKPQGLIRSRSDLLLGHDGMTTTAFVGWSAAFFAGHLGGAAVGIACLVALYLAFSVIGLVVSVPIVIVAITAPYFFIGKAHARRYHGRIEAWKPALASIVVPAVAVWASGGGLSLTGLTFLPAFAYLGAYSNSRSRSANSSQELSYA